MGEAEIVERLALVPDDEPAEVAQPGDEALDLPATPVAAQRPVTLDLGPLAVPPVLTT